MRLVLAALVTTIVPTIVGRQWIRGPEALRWGLGSMIGIALLGWGVIVGGLLGSAEAGAVVLMIAGFFGARFLRHRGREPAAQPLAAPPILAVVAILGVSAFLMVLSTDRPVAGYDGWAMWAFKGKAIAASGDFSAPVFTDPFYEYAHQDYPPLLPAWHATAYRLSGDQTIGWPTQFQHAWLWTAAALALVSLVRVRGRVAGLVLIAWLIAPQMVFELMKGYADVPMALFLVVGMVALIRVRDVGYAPAAILLAAAALLKQEGLVFVGAALLPLVVSRRFRRPALVSVATVAAAFAPWGAFIAFNGFVADVALPRTSGAPVPIERDFAARLPVVLRTLGSEVIRPASWGVLVPAGILALALGRFRPAALTGAFLLGAAAVIVFYVFTPNELVWHLSRSVARLVIAPLGLLAVAAEGAGLTSVAARDAPEPRESALTGASTESGRS